MTIDLSKYIGQEVVATLANGGTLSGVVKFNNDSESYPYAINVWFFDRSGEGFTMPYITSITPINPSPMDGIAQRSPNINLKDFEGQNVYVKWSNGEYMTGTVSKTSYNEWLVSDRGYLNKSGKYIVCPTNSSHIEEIYGEGAYEIKTKQTFDEPSDNAVEKAKEAIKDLTEEQIAKLLHSLKK
jgi:small nuclear ribonucleoprotein (snRNP)-like protein